MQIGPAVRNRTMMRIYSSADRMIVTVEQSRWEIELKDRKRDDRSLMHSIQ